MSKKVIALCAVFSLVSPSTLFAGSWSAATAKWVEVRTETVGAVIYTHYIDANSIQSRGNYKDVWEKKIENVTDPNKVAVTVGRWRYDCKSPRDMMLYFEDYLKTGALVSSEGIPESQRTWDPIMPKSTAEAIQKFACSH